jgi:hypothetical protein
MSFPYANIRGDHSTEFSFSYLFPKMMRPTVDRITSGMIYPVMVKVSKGWLAVGQADTSLAYTLPMSLYSPGDTAAASAALSTLTNSSKLAASGDVDKRSKALRFLDENIAALKTETTEDTGCYLDPDI